MKISKLAVSNFLAIGSATISFKDRGLCLIQGVNEDDTSANSNGAGKSSLVDALSWCLYGETARGVGADDVINNKVGKDCVVTVEIEDGAERYEIARHRKHKVGKNGLVLRRTEPAPTIDLTKGTDKLTQIEVEKLIGCSHEVFVGAIYAGQEKMPDLPAMTDKALKLLVEEASGVTLLAQAYEESRRRAAETKSELEQARIRLQAFENDVARGRVRFDNAKADMVAFTTNQKGMIDSQTLTATALSLEWRAAKAALHVLPDSTKITAEIAAVDASIAGLAHEQKQLAALEAKVVATEKDLDKKRTYRSFAVDERTKYEAELAAADHQIGCPCSTCARPLTAEEIKPLKDGITDSIDAMRDKIEKIDALLDIAQKTLESAVSARNAFKATMHDVTALNAQRASLSDQLSKIEHQLHAEQRARTNLAVAAKELKRLREETNPYAKIVTALAAEITNIETNDIAPLQLRIKELEASAEVDKLVTQVFSPAGVRAHILDEVTPFLNSQTAKYLGVLSDGNILATWTTLVRTAKGELREKFSIEVTKTGASETFQGLSGGEKRKVRVATALALQDLVARRVSKPIELFIADEIDQALDDAGLERLTMVLEEKAAERGSVFVISHNALSDWIPQTVTMTMKGGISTLSEEIV